MMIDKIGRDGVRLVGYSYDARPHRILKRAERRVVDGDVSAAAAALALRLVDGVPLDGSVPTPPPPVTWQRKLNDKLAALYAWKGFWYVVGGVAGAIVLGTAVGVGVGVARRIDAAENVIVIGGR